MPRIAPVFVKNSPRAEAAMSTEAPRTAKKGDRATFMKLFRQPVTTGKKRKRTPRAKTPAAAFPESTAADTLSVAASSTAKRAEKRAPVKRTRITPVAQAMGCKEVRARELAAAVLKQVGSLGMDASGQIISTTPQVHLAEAAIAAVEGHNCEAPSASEAIYAAALKVKAAQEAFSRQAEKHRMLVQMARWGYDLAMALRTGNEKEARLKAMAVFGYDPSLASLSGQEVGFDLYTKELSKMVDAEVSVAVEKARKCADVVAQSSARFTSTANTVVQAFRSAHTFPAAPTGDAVSKQDAKRVKAVEEAREAAQKCLAEFDACVAPLSVQYDGLVTGAVNAALAPPPPTASASATTSAEASGGGDNFLDVPLFKEDDTVKSHPEPEKAEAPRRRSPEPVSSPHYPDFCADDDLWGPLTPLGCDDSSLQLPAGTSGDIPCGAGMIHSPLAADLLGDFSV